MLAYVITGSSVSPILVLWVMRSLLQWFFVRLHPCRWRVISNETPIIWPTHCSILQPHYCRQAGLSSRLRCQSLEQSPCTSHLIGGVLSLFSASAPSYPDLWLTELTFTDLNLYCIKGALRLFVLVLFFWLRVLDKAEYSSFESTLNSSIVSCCTFCCGPSSNFAIVATLNISLMLMW